ncbi:hypothetical protein AO721_01415 [Aeromonas veronii]|nr:hypothetical protein AO728_01230 [Aeromonas veronii]KRV79026.1 hypothetical protein AO719_01230 [Aeromonas veronii]KRV90630.1 hypothetical protein AO721_01415 [Aeromonas veronii]KRV91908.1 hypothetical protein AO739_00620 [Aeromonas veronii]
MCIFFVIDSVGTITLNIDKYLLSGMHKHAVKTTRRNIKTTGITGGANFMSFIGHDIWVFCCQRRR